MEVVNFLNRGILVPAKVKLNSLENDDLGTIEGNFIKHYPKGSNVNITSARGFRNMMIKVI